MKKLLLAILAICVLLALALSIASCDEPTPPPPTGGDTPSQGESGDTPSQGESGDTPSQGESGDTPSQGESGGTPSTPDTPDTPDKPDTPDEPDVPDVPDEPDVPDKPVEPDEPVVPDEPVGCAHEYGDWTVVRVATCKSYGQRKHKCRLCFVEEFEPIDKLTEHTPVTDAAVVATCRAEGKTEGSHCSSCGEVLVAQTTIKKLPHTFSEWVTARESTCAVAGVRQRSCDCGTTEKEDLPKPAHTYRPQKTVAATCKAAGYTVEACACGATRNTAYTTVNIFAHDRYEGETTVYDETQKQTYTYTCWMCRHCGIKFVDFGRLYDPRAGIDVSWYVTGDAINYRDFEIVVYGTGAIPDFGGGSRHGMPPWNSYMPQAKKITVGDGITVIGEGAFYHEDSQTSVEFLFPSTLKTVKRNGIGLRANALTFREGLERIEYEGIRFMGTGATAVYLPKSVTYIGSFSTRLWYVYEGTREEFLSIRTFWYNGEKPIGEAFSPEQYASFAVALNAKNLYDRDEWLTADGSKFT